MTKYEMTIAKAESMGLKVVDGYNFKSNLKGMVSGRVVAISKKVKTENEKVCTLYEEMAHYQTNAGNITNQDNENNRYQERKAHKRMVHEHLPLERIVATVAALGVDTNAHEVAAALDVTEDFLREAVEVYRAEYGESTQIGPFRVSFGPFNIRRLKL